MLGNANSVIIPIMFVQIVKTKAANQMLFGIRMVLCIVLAWTAVQWPVQASTGAGKVMFVSGGATRQAPMAAAQPIARDAQVSQGDRLITAADGYVYVRMADGALLVLRPNSSLTIDQWQYNPERPEQSQIKYTLQQGVSRYVSGKGSQAAKDRFRFNTPMAAIGVRGTDFTVLSRNDLTQVTVRSGGVVVSPFDVSCRREALGPCEGRTAAELFATQGASFLQLRAGEDRPQLIRPNGNPGPDQTAPALGNEPTARNNRNNGTESVEASLTTESRSERLASTLANVPSLTAWGRWGQLSPDEATAFMRQLLQGRQLVSISSDYALARNVGFPMQLPESGVGRFRLTEHDGIYRESSGATPQPTQSTGGSLQIDFAQRKYQTDLQLNLNGQALQFQSKGTVDPGNLLQSSVLNPTTSLKGVVGGADAGQAAYLYRSTLPTGAEITGITAWGR
jgi:hypothetical protein